MSPTACIKVRGFSVASITIVDGKIGVIVFDTLATPGAALGAL
jgi:alkyl sulfatase BDS1-like metallo-beta-lactamase superfamily hydrolase